MESDYLIDTNITIYFLQGRLPQSAIRPFTAALQHKPRISIITKIELLSWDEATNEVQNFVDDCMVYPLTEKIIECCVELRKVYKTKLPDAIIAATAIASNLSLVTRNESDFKRIRKLVWVNPFQKEA